MKSYAKDMFYYSGKACDIGDLIKNTVVHIVDQFLGGVYACRYEHARLVGDRNLPQSLIYPD